MCSQLYVDTDRFSIMKIDESDCHIFKRNYIKDEQYLSFVYEEYSLLREMM